MCVDGGRASENWMKEGGEKKFTALEDKSERTIQGKLHNLGAQLDSAHVESCASELRAAQRIASFLFESCALCQREKRNSPARSLLSEERKMTDPGAIVFLARRERFC